MQPVVHSVLATVQTVHHYFVNGGGTCHDIFRLSLLRIISGRKTLALLYNVVPCFVSPLAPHTCIRHCCGPLIHELHSTVTAVHELLLRDNATSAFYACMLHCKVHMRSTTQTLSLHYSEAGVLLSRGSCLLVMLRNVCSQGIRRHGATSKGLLRSQDSAQECSCRD